MGGDSNIRYPEVGVQTVNGLVLKDASSLYNIPNVSIRMVILEGNIKLYSIPELKVTFMMVILEGNIKLYSIPELKVSFMMVGLEGNIKLYNIPKLKISLMLVGIEGNIKVYSCGYQLAAGVGKKL